MGTDVSKPNVDRLCTVGKLDLTAEIGVATDAERIRESSQQQTARAERSDEAVRGLSEGGSD